MRGVIENYSGNGGAVAKIRQAHRLIPRLKCKHPKLRKQLEQDTPAWLKHYTCAAYPLDWGQVHLDIIAGAEGAIKTGGKFVVASPRGTGKSTVLWGVTLKSVLSGEQMFPVLIPWKASDLRKALRFWKNALCFTKRLLEDYPEFCQPFAVSRGSSQKCLTLGWEDNGEICGAELRMSDGMIIFPDGKGAIGSATINGNPRGLNHASRSGAILRPTSVLIDDPQDKMTAKSSTQVAVVVDVIDTDVLGMAGPDSRMPALMSCTCLIPNDVAAHYLTSPEWKACKTGQIVTWPNDMKAWREFGEAIKEQRENDAIAYYTANRELLSDGLTVSWSERYDKKRGEPDALYSAMRDYYFMGHAAFMAERQNEPVDEATSYLYQITPALILSHIVDRPRLHLPDAASVFCGHCDVNHYGLHYCLSSFQQDMTGHCVEHGRWPERGAVVEEKNTPELEIRQAIFRALKGLCDKIEATVYGRNNLRIKLGLLLIDVGYQPEAIQQFCQQTRYSFKVLPSIGRPAKDYRVKADSLVGRPFEYCHIQRAQKVGHGPYMMFHSDYWREVAQRAFLGVCGEPGGYTLHAVDNPKHHQIFAEHVSAERLSNKYVTPGGTRWEWTHRPGAQWDLADALTGSWVAAAASGLSASGVTAITPRPQRKRGGVSVIAM